MNTMTGIKTNHALAFWVGLMVGLVLVFHFIGVRVIFTAGRAVA